MWDEEDLRASSTPLWAQLAQRLREGIENGEFAVGSLLPSEAQIVERFGVSRGTARAALNKTAAEGRAERRSGKGTRVLPAPVELPLNILTSFAEDMRSRGIDPGYREISITVGHPREAAIARALGMETGREALRISRVLLASDEAIAVSVSWLSPTLVPIGMEAESHRAATGSLYSWLESRLGQRVSRGTEIIAASLADRELAVQLNIHVGDPVLHSTRIAHTQSGEPVEYVDRYYRADRYRYRLELVRP